MLVLCALVLGAAGAGCGSSSSSSPSSLFADFSGTWTGTFESANFSTRSITFIVVQTGNCVDGAWTSSTADWHGAISGTATVDSFSGFLSFERSSSGGGQCNATASVSALAGQTLRLTADALTAVGSCSGDLPKAIVLSLHR